MYSLSLINTQTCTRTHADIYGSFPRPCFNCITKIDYVPSIIFRVKLVGVPAVRSSTRLQTQQSGGVVKPSLVYT